MVGALKIFGIVIVTSLGLAVFTQYQDGVSVNGLFGEIPVVAAAQKNAFGLIALGQVNARGVIVIAQNGYGLITLAQGGVGLLFGVGQLMAGMMVIGQLGLGLLFFLGQVGFGACGTGQLAGYARGAEYLKEMSAEFNELLSFRGRPSAG
jgi:hypothetical protein